MNADAVEPDACDVCGRHMLFGEQTREYVTPERERRGVCDLCRTKVKRAGWVRADRADRGLESPAQPAERPRRARVLARVAPRRDRARQPERPARPAAAEPQPPADAAERATETPERRIRRALDRFNHSEHRRTVQGLTRSLGEPRVAAVTPAQAPDQVRLTVAWNISWYQWKVEFSDGDPTVREFRNGKEVSELGPGDRAWNARAGKDGRIQLRIGADEDAASLAPDEAA